MGRRDVRCDKNKAMIQDKTYSEIISRYSLDELNEVKKRIDANAYPDRYELVLKEIKRRMDSIGPAKLLNEDTGHVLNKPIYNDSESKSGFYLTIKFLH